MKRLGIRKVAAAAVDTKVGAGADTVVSVVAKKSTDLVNFVGRKVGLKSNLKVNISGKVARKKVNLSTQAKIEQSDRNLIEQGARDIQSTKDWEKEKERMDAYIESSRGGRFPADDVQVERRDGSRI